MSSCNCAVTQPGPTIASTCGGSQFMLFMGLLEVFIRSQCDIEDPCGRPVSRSVPDREYDFIVVGAGAGGSVVASRLSEVPNWKVLIIEAGGNEPTGTQVPSMFFNFIGSSIDWNYKTEPEEMACLGEKEKRCGWPRGKVLGGTSVMNGMMYMRGSRHDYDNWAKLGNPGWSYQDVLPYFLKSEDNLQATAMDPGYHAVGGPLPVGQFPYHPPLSHALLQGGVELGYQVRDLNGAIHTGFTIAQTMSRNGSRYSTARAFLRPAKNRPNLHFLLNATVTKILIDPVNKTAYGVEVFKDGKVDQIIAKNEVIVSGGAINSPQLLLLSGIGPKEDLNAVKVPVIHNLPGVGKNLQNHVAHFVNFFLNDSATTPLNWATAMEYLLFRDGLMSGTGISEVTAILPSKYANPVDDFPDLQYFFGGYLADCAKTGQVGEKYDDSPKRAIQMIPAVLHPKSRGYLKLKSSNPLEYPAIYAKYLTHPDDVATLIDGVKIAIRLSETSALRKYGMELDRKPVMGCEDIPFGCDAYWECAIRRKTGPENHQAGTCKMGPISDPSAVVDPELKVHGIDKLRVVDASIMPTVTSGNTNVPIIMIGEKASDMIKRRWIGRKAWNKWMTGLTSKISLYFSNSPEIMHNIEEKLVI
ncbi:glucose dehydrogenase [FAD, quinone] isoform X2 [Daktulosphaira vitifoliae]|nr:glucose dehydrogenase [FAD, quinone] isoform X2 [Daktulosphaira vitifoliae]XP_050539707.1 glucose dehydrogenase [FAD, quinone] isoform X2 [Daktulosphaira vitifoliae]